MPQWLKRIRLANVIVGLLVVQYVLGMLANMYAMVPADRPYLVFIQHGPIEFHAYNGVLLLILATVFLVRSVRAKAHKVAAITGLASIVLAFTCGELFVFTQYDPWSLLMSFSFLGAFTSYLWVIIRKVPNDHA